MMKIQIFGSGCEKCTKLYDAVQKVVQQHELMASVEKVSNIDEITAAGVMMTPALGLDGKIVSAGKVLAESDILHLLAPEHASHCGCQGEVAGPPPNRLKQLISLLLLAVVGASLAVMVMRESRRPTGTGTETLSQEGTTVYYFYGNHRCATCNRMEGLTQKAIKDKGVAYKAVNLDEPANEHFVKDFQLDARVVVIQRGGSYKKMDAVWDLVSDEDAFISYIQRGLQDK
jgi:small redox-active disulfide protein 2